MSKIICSNKFKGDVVITDPCYFVSKKEKIQSPLLNTKYKPQYDTSRLTAVELETYKRTRDNHLEAYSKYVESVESDWDRCEYGLNMKALGFDNYLCTDNLYGNWSCTLYETNNSTNLGDENNAEISKFCSDSGLVGVFLLSEIVKYDSEFDIKKFKHNEVGIVENFQGTIYIINRTEKTGFEAEVMVVGVGNINFFSLQTGL